MFISTSWLEKKSVYITDVYCCTVNTYEKRLWFVMIELNDRSVMFMKYGKMNDLKYIN